MDVDEEPEINQADMNDLVRVLNLDKSKSEILVSMIKRLLRRFGKFGIKFNVSFFRNRTEELKQFFKMFDEFTVYLHDVSGFLQHIGVAYNSTEWRLFMDSSLSSFKACLIFNRRSSSAKKCPVIPLVYSTNLTESYEDLGKVLCMINYHREQWLICCDLKITNCLMGLMGGSCKYSCLFCVWDSRARSEHYEKKSYSERVYLPTVNPNEKPPFNQIKPPLVNIDRILLPPLHLKLGVWSQLVKALVPSSKTVRGISIVKEGNPAAIEFLHKLICKSDAKLAAGQFTGPEIRKVIKNRSEFVKVLSGLEKKCFLNFVKVVENFFGNFKSDNHQQLIERMIRDFKELNVLMSVKLHYLHCHLDKFRESCGGYGEEQGENFHKEMSVFERRYKGKIYEMFVDYAWCRFLETDYQGRMSNDNYLRKDLSN